MRAGGCKKPDPTPAEIVAACEEIQATWSETVRRSRAGWAYAAKDVEFPVLRAADDRQLRNLIDAMQ